ncbi:hypothetical protein, partial [Streptococcus sobrinus]|uniref:hypothetical protein n=1 Tax=Streptococcus sobrinus TaxID=1310 RepID=UPI0005B4B902
DKISLSSLCQASKKAVKFAQRLKLGTVAILCQKARCAPIPCIQVRFFKDNNSFTENFKLETYPRLIVHIILI